ncbi:hypothetical protein CGCA056_v000341 [Colletotrichum aenigma]|uniref:uncharacterized protein n=1 Tax=Colletotrichum aenigma TaxID=1215731 RepID=UPI0018731C7A|nr:uncharacterized protein CGCA056_v000341 [Colletotrichum aenigma]KAF5527216.1 hypothetical protein CGCA056_v000341 [Colletotrichum aenigma]
MSLLCNKCRVIQFNDADYDGTVNVWTNGESYFAPKDDGDITQCLFLDYDLKDVVPDLPVLSQSAENGCALCLLIKTEVTKFLQGVELEHADFFIHKLCYAMQKHVVDEPPYRPRLHALFVFFRILNRTSGEEDVSWTLRLEIQAEPTDPCAQWLSIPRQPIQENILSKAGMQRLNELMETISEIPSLPPAIDDQDLPTRLIDTGLRGPGIENEEPRLVVTADYPPLQNIDGDQRYVALSYCWGPPEKAKLQLTTQTSTLDDRLRQIPFSTFPKTHQDAIRLCVFLGVRYVWIDSLCIVQDDKSDWEREAQQMGSVYANAFLTVCAAQGDSCLDGFLTRRYPSNSVEVSFASTLNPSVSGCYSIFASPREYATVLPLIIGEEFNKHLDFSLLGIYDPYSYDKECNWNERGWTFQEVVLSQRSLLFGQRMVHVCSGDELIQSEEAIHTTAPEEVCDSLTEFLSDVLEEDSVESAKSMFSKWRELVSEYSHRSFTYQNDILPALSALAKIWVERVGVSQRKHIQHHHGAGLPSQKEA